MIKQLLLIYFDDFFLFDLKCWSSKYKEISNTWASTTINLSFIKIHFWILTFNYCWWIKSSTSVAWFYHKNKANRFTYKAALCDLCALCGEQSALYTAKNAKYTKKQNYTNK